MTTLINQQVPGMSINVSVSFQGDQPSAIGLQPTSFFEMQSGWIPPTLDMRDYYPEHPEIIKLTEKLAIPDVISLPSKTDLTGSCSPVRDQGQGLLSCTAFAGTGIIEYFENKAFGKNVTASPLFLYKCTRNLMQVSGNVGTESRDVMKALALFGVPGESYWPYIRDKYDNEPGAFLYAMAANYKAEKYFCHDPLFKNVAGPDVLVSIKRFLAAGVPAIFGFKPPSPIVSSDIDGGMPFLEEEDGTSGHALVAVGYDDTKIISSRFDGAITTTGALLIRNCKGPKWGAGGYGWLPYKYVETKRATDFWSLLSMKWIDTGNL